jgi:hypothetical protein
MDMYVKMIQNLLLVKVVNYGYFPHFSDLKYGVLCEKYMILACVCASKIFLEALPLRYFVLVL